MNRLKAISRLLPIGVTLLLLGGVARAYDGDDYDWPTWRKFWSFQPVRKPAPPAVKDAKWGRNAIDAFLLAELEEKGLKPAAEADQATLVRRATFDLTGQPPTPAEVRAFLADKSPDAYEKLIDRLLASPHYGQRWGRHWLDVARYVQGRISFPGVKNSSGDQAYRDYVVRAFNEDKPYDRFLTEQLAGDLLPPAADRQARFDQLTAPAFLSIGAWFDMCTDPNRLKLEMVDEMINATTKTFLGLSVACARCHDHKFDPIPQADYYALGGVFRSTRLVGDFSEFWRDGRVRQLRPLAMPDEIAANEKIEAQIGKVKAERWAFLSSRHAELMGTWKADEARYRAVASGLPKMWVKQFEAEEFDGQDNLRINRLMRDGNPVEVIETQTPTAQWVKYKLDVPTAGTYTLEALYSTDARVPLQVQLNGKTVAQDALSSPTGGWDLAYQRWRTVATFELREGLNFVRLNAKEGDFPRLDRLRLFAADESAASRLRAAASSENLNPTLLAEFAKDPANPWPAIAGIDSYFDAPQQQALATFDAEAERLWSQVTPHPLVISVTDQQQPADLPLHIKGDTYKQSSKPSPRGLPRLLDHAIASPAIPPAHSGRLELARWLADPRHPLTARVMANRVWHWHFGRGIVATTSDFGSRGDLPTHPELLDYLAATFVEDGWSIKKLHRLIMTSSAYRMSSAASEQATQIDPENKLLSHFSRRRLEAEAIYDALLATNNTLVRQETGTPLDVEKAKNKALYVLTSGRAPKGLGPDVRKFFTLFDYDASGAPIAERPTSATPAQSLFWLNSPLVTSFADRFAERLLKMDKLTDRQRVNEAYMLALGRMPSAEMNAAALAYIEGCRKEEGLSDQAAWARFCQALYAADEFRYVD